MVGEALSQGMTLPSGGRKSATSVIVQVGFTGVIPQLGLFPLRVSTVLPRPLLVR